MLQPYPRPQLRRESFLSLDGEWLLNGCPVQLPYPPQSPASGWQGAVPEQLHYQRSFTLPKGFCPDGWRVLLHFGAVDQLCFVFVNGRPAVSHEGGYLPFEADITPLLQPGENLLQVEATDALDHDYPYGKQCAKPHGMWYTPVSGIWQSVWLEAVPARHITGLRMDSDCAGLTLTAEGSAESCTVELWAEEHLVLRRTCVPGQPLRLEPPQPRCWSPEDPFLYRLCLRAGEDCCESYAGLRQVSIEADAHGVQRLCLNGQPVFLSAVLDQGYFPQGLFLPGSGEESIEQDVRRVKELGFNTIRMHIKVEQPAFYEACDRLGVLVIQDMVQSGAYSYLFDTVLPNLGLQRRTDRLPGSRKRRAFFLRHCLDTQAQLWNHPCVVLYTIFNEGWGQHHTSAVYRHLKEHDPGRLYISASGWFKGYESDLDSDHVYFRNRALRPGQRPLLLSECGGYSRAMAGHMYRPDKRYGYGAAESEEALGERISQLWREMVHPAIAAGLCGVVYTQLYDVEEEINGLFTYDRQLCKVNAALLRGLNQRSAELLQEAVKG